ncbi:3356_t:CDS:2, partial [Acaulospora morrowiae]
NLPVDVFVAILNEGYSRFNEADMTIKGNDMELFRFLSAGPLVISQAERKLKENIKTQAPEEYPPKDGYENDRQLNVIARSILIYPDLVLLWKSIGYVEICRDVNDLVLQGALLILFPQNPSESYILPNVSDVV